MSTNQFESLQSPRCAPLSSIAHSNTDLSSHGLPTCTAVFCLTGLNCLGSMLLIRMLCFLPTRKRTVHRISWCRVLENVKTKQWHRIFCICLLLPLWSGTGSNACFTTFSSSLFNYLPLLLRLLLVHRPTTKSQEAWPAAATTGSPFLVLPLWFVSVSNYLLSSNFLFIYVQEMVRLFSMSTCIWHPFACSVSTIIYHSNYTEHWFILSTTGYFTFPQTFENTDEQHTDVKQADMETQTRFDKIWPT